MIDDQLDYRLLKVKNGKPFFAIINLEISRNAHKNEIIEDYLGEGFTSQGNIESVPTKIFGAIVPRFGVLLCC